MKFRKSWCGFFTTVGGMAVTGLALTAKYSQSACHALATETLDLIQTFLDSDLGVTGEITMDIEMGDSLNLPVKADNVVMKMHLALSDAIVEKLKTLPVEFLEKSCRASIWETGTQDVALLLLLALGITGVVLTYNHAKQQEEKPRVMI